MRVYLRSGPFPHFLALRFSSSLPPLLFDPLFPAKPSYDRPQLVLMESPMLSPRRPSGSAPSLADMGAVVRRTGGQIPPPMVRSLYRRLF